MDLFNKNELNILIKSLLRLTIIFVLFLSMLFFWMQSPTKVSTQTIVFDENPWEVETLLAIHAPRKEVQKGFELVMQTAKIIGPHSKTPVTGNRLSCTHCHRKGGTQNGAASWLGITKRYPKFSARDGRTADLADRINGCLERSMNGTTLSKKDDIMKAILAYMKWLDQNYISLTEHQKGFPPIQIPNRAANLITGKVIYHKECVECHGTDGKGTSNAYPPLWGNDSYNQGAGMHRVLTAAAFIKANMPYEQSRWDQPKLSDEEAFDVAAYINSKSRPTFKGLTNDFPDKKLKPMSTPYGPWQDTFTAKQHKFGPFPPIKAYYKKKYGLDKKK